MRVQLIQILHRVRSDQSGQSLIIVALAMTAMLGMAAMGIDVSTWYQKHHQAQVVADAAALAAANCLAKPNTGPSPQCTSSSDTTDATTVAENYATDNGISITAGQVSINTTNDTVKVTPSSTGSNFFAGLFGVPSTTESASATASWTAPTSSCSTPGSSCAAVFAMGSSCSNTAGEPGGSPIIFNGSSDTINGIVHSNGSIYEAGGGSQTLGSTTFGNGSGCEIDTSNESGDTWGGSSTPPASGETPITTWPEDYTTVVTPCGSGYSYACTGPDGTPSYCTEAAGTAGSSSINSASSTGFTYGSKSEDPPSGNVWCAYGSGTPSEPSTWNGLIYLESDSTTVTGNWIGGTIEFGNSGWGLSPQVTSFPVLYATGSGNCSSASNGGVCVTGGGQKINGSIFAPNGWIQFNGAGGTTDDFLEGQYIDFIGGSQDILGDGPTSVTGGSSGGSDSLTQ